MKARSLKEWKEWTESLWLLAEEPWLERDGQDHLYRREVVVPALRTQLESWGGDDAFTLVDLGAGDGFATGLLLESSRSLMQRTAKIVLVDRSERELRQAAVHMAHCTIECVTADLLSENWAYASWAVTGRTAYLAVFVLQELASLGCFLESVRLRMRLKDIFLAIIVAPGYAEVLRRAGKLRDVRSAGSHFDWKWAAEYPISTPAGTLYLPHFQRTLAQYGQLFRRAGLVLSDARGLGLTQSHLCARTFENTAYGRGILGSVSSRLLVTALARQGR